ncbi:MAG: Uma2 family endonuclease, partial [Clostridiales bacterium]|nr:Uma2 family endonuclease [Clostridiales bacterium]
YIEKNKGECKIYPAPFAVFLDEENSSYVEPDISVICDKDKLDMKGCHGAPDWIIEIVSPSSKVLDYYKKLALYKMAGVREYWIVDPLKQVIVVYNLEDEEIPIVYHFSDCIKVNIYENLEIDFNDLDV